MDVLQFLLLSFMGGVFGIMLKIPAGALIGPMLLVGTFQLTEIVVLDEIPQFIKWIAQAMLGLMIGLMFSKEILKISSKQLAAFLIIGFSSIITSFLFGLLIYQTSDLSFLTSVISAVPGSMAEMLALAESLDTNTQAVAMIHLLRFLLIMLILPFILSWAVKKNNKYPIRSESNENH